MTFDFTTMRLGKLAGPYKRKIIVCPNCGRRGTDNGVMGINKKQGYRLHSCTHTGEMRETAGNPFFHIKDGCAFWTTTEGIPIPKEVKAHG